MDNLFLKRRRPITHQIFDIIVVNVGDEPFICPLLGCVCRPDQGIPFWSVDPGFAPIPYFYEIFENLVHVRQITSFNR